MYGYVYKTTNLVNNKIYVGQHKENNRKYLGSGILLNRAIEKYGKTNFKLEILEWCETKDILNEREIYWIDKLNARDLSVGYNIALGGDGGSPHIYLDEKRKTERYKKTSQSLKGRVRTEEHRRNLSQSLKGRKLSEEHRANIKKAKDSMSNERKADINRRISETLKKTGYMIGKTHTEEAKMKISKTHKGKVVSQETRYKIANEYIAVYNKKELYFRSRADLCAYFYKKGYKAMRNHCNVDYQVDKLPKKYVGFSYLGRKENYKGMNICHT